MLWLFLKLWINCDSINISENISVIREDGSGISAGNFQKKEKKKGGMLSEGILLDLVYGIVNV